MSYDVGHRCDLDPSWLWLWWRPAAIALIPPLAWEPPYPAKAALKSKQQQQTRQRAKSDAFCSALSRNFQRGPTPGVSSELLSALSSGVPRGKGTNKRYKGTALKPVICKVKKVSSSIKHPYVSSSPIACQPT